MYTGEMHPSCYRFTWAREGRICSCALGILHVAKTSKEFSRLRTPKTCFSITATAYKLFAQIFNFFQHQCSLFRKRENNTMTNFSPFWKEKSPLCLFHHIFSCLFVVVFFLHNFLLSSGDCERLPKETDLSLSLSRLKKSDVPEFSSCNSTADSIGCCCFPKAISWDLTCWGKIRFAGWRPVKFFLFCVLFFVLYF